MKRIVLSMTSLLCGLLSVSAANKYLRVGASGAANGNNWTDAYIVAKIERVKQ